MILANLLVLSAIADGGKDYASLPPDPAATFKQVSNLRMSLTQAIELARKDAGGVVRSVQLDLGDDHALYQLEVCTGERAFLLTIDADQGKVTKRVARDRFPGDPVQGPWTETASGLKYWDLTLGTGAQPRTKESRVKVHYTGWLTDGTKFDSSFDRGEAYITSLDQVIAGWSEGVLGMKVGGKRKLVIPYELAYGVEGTQGVPGRAMLIFDVELIEILDDLPPSPEAKCFEEVKAANEKLMQLFKAGDMKGVAAMYTDDAVLLGPGGVRIEGRKPIDDYWMGIEHPIDWQLEVLSLDGKDDLLHQIGRSVLTSADDAGKHNSSEVFFSVIWRRQADGNLKVAVDAYWPPK